VERLSGDPAEFFEGGPPGAPAPQVNGQQPRQRDHGFLPHRGAVGQFGFHPLRGFPVGLPAQEAPHRFDQQGAHAAVAHPVDGAQAAVAAAAVFARTTPGVAADLFAVVEAVPIAHFAVEGAEGEFTQSLGPGLILHPRFDLGQEGTHFFFQRQDERAQFGEESEQPRIEGGEFLPVARTPPVGREWLVAILGGLAMTAIGQTAHLAGQELPAARDFAAALLGFGGNTDGGEFVAVAIEPAGEAQAEGAGVELVGLARAVEGDGRDEEALRAGRDEPTVEREAEAARFLHAEDLVTFGDPFLDLLDELVVGELARGVWRGVIFLRHGHDEFQMHVQAQLEQWFGGIDHGRGQRLARRQGRDGEQGSRGRGGGGHEGLQDVGSGIALGGGLWCGVHHHEWV